MINISCKMNNQLIVGSSYYYFTVARFFAGLFCRLKFSLSET